MEEGDVGGRTVECLGEVLGAEFIHGVGEGGCEVQSKNVDRGFIMCCVGPVEGVGG